MTTINISSIETKKLSLVLSDLRRFLIGQKTHKELLSLKDDKLTVSAQGETREFESFLPVQYKGEEIIFSADIKKLYDFLQTLQEDYISIEIGDQKIKIKNKQATGVFPLTKEIGEKTELKKGSIKISTKIFASALSPVLFACSQDTARPALSSINFIPLTQDNTRIVATDGFRLSLVQITQNLGIESAVLVPAGFLSESVGILKSADQLFFGIDVEGKKINLSQGSTSLSSQLLSGDYPAYEKVLVQSHQHSFVLQKKEIEAALKTVGVFARDHSNIAVFCIENKSILIRPKKEAGQESGVSIQRVNTKSEEKLTIAFNIRYILDFLGSIEDEQFTIRVNRPETPILFLSTRDYADPDTGIITRRNLYQKIKEEE